MEAVRRGGDRQELHEKLRIHARASAEKRKRDGQNPDLFERIAGDPAFGLDRGQLEQAASPQRLVGRAAEQVERFLREELEPALEGVGQAETSPLRV
jgi:adenylosuccinate lyase